MAEWGIAAVEALADPAVRSRFIELGGGLNLTGARAAGASKSSTVKC
jgi:hypothetical protein